MNVPIQLGCFGDIHLFREAEVAKQSLVKAKKQNVPNQSRAAGQFTVAESLVAQRADLEAILAAAF